jgi:flagellar assembly protein FliH
MSSSLSAATPAAAAPSGFDFEQLTPPAPREPAPSLESAAAQARALVAAAEAEAGRIREQSRQAGLAEGFAAGRDAARSELEPVASAMADAVRSLEEMQGEAADRVEAHAVELAVRIAEKVVAGAVAVEPERLLDVVRGALRTIVERERVVVLVHPEDLDLMREGVAGLTGSLGGMEHVEVQEERRARRGGAIVRTAYGEVDARLDTKLERARAAVEAELRR